MCEKCQQLAERADHARETIIDARGEDAFRSVYDASLGETITVELPVAVSKLMFPILQILHMNEEAQGIAVAFAFADMAHDIRDVIELQNRYYPMAASIAKTALDDICHKANERMVSYMEGQMYA